MPQDPGLEDRERLERFLEWRRADDKSRKTARRHTAGMATVAVAVAALITAAAWYAIDGHRRAALMPTTQPDARVARAPGVDTDSKQKPVSPAARLPLSRPESERGDSDVTASSAQATPLETTAAEAPSTPAEPTPAQATPASPEATSSLATSAAPPMPSPPPVARQRAAARLELPPRRSVRVAREAGRVPTAPTTPDVAASPPPEPAPIAATPVAPPPPAVVPDTPRATLPPPNAESVRSEPSTLAAPPIPTSPATRTEDAAAAVSRPTAPQTGSIGSDAVASVAEQPARLAAPAPQSTGQILKEWAGYIPEVRLARAIYRWGKKQPPPDGTRPEEPQPPQAR